MAFLAALGLAGPLAYAQIIPPQGSPARSPNRLADEVKLKYIARQLELTAEQQKLYDEMIVVVYRQTRDAALQDLRQRAEELAALYTALQQANRDRDQKKVQAIQQAMHEMNPTHIGEVEFFEGVRQQILTEEQLKLLTAARARLLKNPTGRVTVDDVCRAARATTLTDEQAKKLAELRRKHEARSGVPARPRSILSYTRAVDDLVRAVRALLAPEQTAKLDRRISSLRPNPSAPKPKAAEADKDKPQEKNSAHKPEQP